MSIEGESFIGLLDYPHDILAVRQGVADAVANSFRQDLQRGELLVMTADETKKRAEICVKWFKIMRRDCGYSTERTVDFLSLALRKELDKEDWAPPKADENSAWAPSVIQGA